MDKSVLFGTVSDYILCMWNCDQRSEPLLIHLIKKTSPPNRLG